MGLKYPNPVFPCGYGNNVIDPALNNTFKYEILGASSCVAYRLYILDTNNNVIYDGGKVTLSTPLTNKKILSIPISAGNTNCVAGNKYKHKLLAFYTDSLFVSSLETPFSAYTTPSLSINIPSSPYGLQHYTFTLNYTQAQNVAIKDFMYVLSDNDGNQIDEYGLKSDSDTSWYVDGLKSGETYKIQASVINQEGVICTSAIGTFSVSYLQANIILIPTVTHDAEHNAIELSWEASQLNGVPSSPDIYSFLPNFIYANNTGIVLEGDVNFDVEVPDDFTYHVVFAPHFDKNGALTTIVTQSGHSYVLSFDGTNLVYKKDGVTLSTINALNYGLNYWHIILLKTEAIFKFIVTNQLYPSSTTYPGATTYPIVLDE